MTEVDYTIDSVKGMIIIQEYFDKKSDRLDEASHQCILRSIAGLPELDTDLEDALFSESQKVQGPMNNESLECLAKVAYRRGVSSFANTPVSQAAVDVGLEAFAILELKAAPWNLPHATPTPYDPFSEMILGLLCLRKSTYVESTREAKAYEDRGRGAVYHFLESRINDELWKGEEGFFRATYPDFPAVDGKGFERYRNEFLEEFEQNYDSERYRGSVALLTESNRIEIARRFDQAYIVLMESAEEYSDSYRIVE
jgi:hypothetical protein